MVGGTWQTDRRDGRTDGRTHELIASELLAGRYENHKFCRRSLELKPGVREIKQEYDVRYEI